MGTQIPIGTTLTDTTKAQTLGKGTMSYRDAVTGEIKTGYPAYSSSGALLGYVSKELSAQELSAQDQLNQNLVVSEAAYDAQMRATGMEDTPIVPLSYAELSTIPTEKLTQGQAAALSKEQYTKQMVDPTGTYQPQGNAVWSGAAKPQVVQAAPTYSGNVPESLKPKIEEIDGKKYVTMEGLAMTRLVQQFYKMGQLNSEAMGEESIPGPTKEYAPSGRQIVNYTDPASSKAAAFDVAYLKKQDPSLNDAAAYRLLKGGQ